MLLKKKYDANYRISFKIQKLSFSKELKYIEIHDLYNINSKLQNAILCCSATNKIHKSQSEQSKVNSNFNNQNIQGIFSKSNANK